MVMYMGDGKRLFRTDPIIIVLAELNGPTKSESAASCVIDRRFYAILKHTEVYHLNQWKGLPICNKGNRAS